MKGKTIKIYIAYITPKEINARCEPISFILIGSLYSVGLLCKKASIIVKKNAPDNPSSIAIRIKY